MSQQRLSTKDQQTDAVELANAMRDQTHAVVARALWYVKPNTPEIRSERLEALRPGEARVATLFSGISRGTERLVASGNVPPAEWDRMRAPFQSGSFDFPVKYGYSTVGKVVAGPDDMLGKTVFSLHPHQSVFQTNLSSLSTVPDSIDPARATLAANMETALNTHWDAGTKSSDKVLVIGAGIVGLLVAYLASRLAGADVTIVDKDLARASIAKALGLTFAAPSKAPIGNAIVFHTSATTEGLETAINHAAFEGKIVELSWYGTKPVSINLGGAFHSQRLNLISSQVGHVSQNKRATTTHADRLAMAISLLDDPRLDALVAERVAFRNLPSELPMIFNDSRGLPPVVQYAQES